MRRLIASLIVAGGALALPACGPAELDVGVGPAYPAYGYGYYDGYYGPYYGPRGYYGHHGFYGPRYQRGVVVGRGYGDHGRHEAYEHRGAAIHQARPAAPMGHPMAAPPPAHHH